jgi:hypothetical protein
MTSFLQGYTKYPLPVSKFKKKTKIWTRGNHLELRKRNLDQHGLDIVAYSNKPTIQKRFVLICFFLNVDDSSGFKCPAKGEHFIFILKKTPKR